MVAWESDDPVLKDLFRRQIDIYTELETGVWLDPRLPQSRQLRKNCIHSVDYGAGKRTLAEKYVGDERSAEHFITSWFTAHPAIRQWQRRVEWDMQQGRTPIVRNAWGFRRVYACATPLTQPLAWIGQSTVSITINKIMLRLADEPGVELLLQIHDSVLMQLPHCKCPSAFERLLALAQQPIPFKPDPLVIPCELKWSPLNWGRMEAWHEPSARNA